MSEILMAVMPYSDYEGACNAIREATGKTDKIPSGQFEAEVRAAISAGGGGGGTDEPVVYSEGLSFKRIIDTVGGETFAYCISGIGTCKDTDLIIPPTHNGYPVVAVVNSAFDSNESITSVVIPNSVSNICDNSFMCCSNLSNITLSHGLNRIGGNAFTMTAITSIEIPDSVTIVDYMAFCWCDYLKTVKFLGETPPVFGEDVFMDCPMLETIEVPANSLDAYKSATNASEYADIMVGV